MEGKTKMNGRGENGGIQRGKGMEEEGPREGRR